MPEETITTKQKDSNAFIIILTVLSILTIIFSEIPFLQVYAAGVLILSFVAASIGKDRQIGSANAFYVTFFLGGVIGLIITILSKRNSDIPPVVKSTGTADELMKFHELKEKGIISEEEFQKQKDRLL